MKKLLTLVAMLLALTFVGKAQNLLEAGFENGYPEGWSYVNNSTSEEPEDWTIYIGPSHSGAHAMYSLSAEIEPDNWLITPAITLPQTGTYQLSFWVRAYAAGYPAEHYGIYVSTSDDPTDVEAYQLLPGTSEVTLDTTLWRNEVHSLNAYLGQTIYLAIRHFNCTDQAYLIVDDFTVGTPVTTPFLGGTTSFNFAPTSVNTANATVQRFYASGMNLTGNVTISTQANSQYKISRNDSADFTSTITLTTTNGVLAATPIYVQFAPTTTGTIEEEITIASTGADSKIVSVKGYGIECGTHQTIDWFENFASEAFPPACWSQIINDHHHYYDETGQDRGEMYTWYGSSQYAAVIGDDDANQDEHLISPTFNFTDVEDALELHFGVRTNPTIPDLIEGKVRFFVNISTDGGTNWNTIWNFASIREEMASTWQGWDDPAYPVAINMDPYIGMDNIVFDFIYQADTLAADQIILSDVKFSNFADPRFAVLADDTMSLFSYLGDPVANEITVVGHNLTQNITVTATTPFEVSTDEVNGYSTSVSMPAIGGQLYVRYNPTTATSATGSVVITGTYSNATSEYNDTTFVKTIVLNGNAYDCSTITIPFVQGFESPKDSVLAPNTTEYCWSTIKVNNRDRQNDMINSEDYAYDGYQAFRFSSSKYNAQGIYDEYLISPELNATEAMMVMFNYANATALKDETFRVGYSTTGIDTSDFVWENDIVNAGNTDWQLYRNTNVPADVKYIAIHYKSSFKAYLYIDNFIVRYVPTCLFPVELKATATTENTADVEWTAGGNETSWEIAYGIAPLDITTVTPQTVSATNTTLSGLTANTHYQMQVRAICSESDNSEWSEVLDFWTTTVPATLPYTQTFEDNDADRANWVLVNGNQANKFAYLTIPASTSGKGLAVTKNGIENLYLTQINDSTITSSYSTVWAYRDIEFPVTTEYGFQLTLNWKCFGEVDYDFGELFIGNATEVTNFDRNENHPHFIDVNETHYTPAGLTKLGRFVGQSTMQSAAYVIPAEDVAGSVKRIYFLWTNDSLSGAETPLAIDNINIKIPVFATIVGVVRRASNQEPIANAKVVIASDNGFSYTTYSDAQGAYTFENIVAASYNYTATANGYQEATGSFAPQQAGTMTVNIDMNAEPCAIIPANPAYEIEDDNMIITWEGVEGGTMTQCNGNLASYIGTGESGNFGCYHLFKPSDLVGFNGGTIDKVSIYVNTEPAFANYVIRIWVGGNSDIQDEDNFGPASSVPTYEQVINPEEVVMNAWTEITLDQPFLINGNQLLWVGYNADWVAPDDEFPCGVTGDHTNGIGNVMHFESSDEWTSLSNLSASLRYNWAIKANVVPPVVTYAVYEDGELIDDGITDPEYVVSPYDLSACYTIATTCENGEISDQSDCVTPVSIENVESEVASFEVYPNPATEVVTVSSSLNAKEVQVLNYLGQVIYTQTVSSNVFTLNVANYADGVYFIRLVGDDTIATQKLVKK